MAKVKRLRRRHRKHRRDEPTDCLKVEEKCVSCTEEKQCDEIKGECKEGFCMAKPAAKRLRRRHRNHRRDEPTDCLKVDEKCVSCTEEKQCDDIKG